MKILVTGAAGFVGSHLAERLASHGHDVVGMDSFADYYRPTFKRATAAQVARAGVRMSEADLAADPLEGLLDGVEVVYHLAAQPGNSARTPFESYVRQNLTATHRLVEAARCSGSLHAFVNISTSSVYGAFAQGDEDTAPAPVSPYGVTKLAAEQLVLARWRDARFPACSCRLFSVYGERERPDKLYPLLLDALANDTPVPLFEGSESHERSYTYVGDIVDGLLAVLDHWDRAAGEIFNLGTDAAITTGEGIRIVEGIVGRPIRIDRRPARPGDQQSTRAKIGKARRLLGYEPHTTPEQGLRRMADWFFREIHGKVPYVT